jgi:hypothetical protein
MQKRSTIILSFSCLKVELSFDEISGHAFNDEKHAVHSDMFPDRLSICIVAMRFSRKRRVVIWLAVYYTIWAKSQ